MTLKLKKKLNKERNRLKNNNKKKRRKDRSRGHGRISSTLITKRDFNKNTNDRSQEHKSPCITPHV